MKERTKKSYRRRNQIPGQFAPRLIEMLRSPAYRALSRAAHQVLARLEIELADHGGMDNGELIVTFDQFEEYGIHRHAIAPAIRELVALGLVEITEQGLGGNAEYRRPSKYRLAYRPVGRAESTDEWRKITAEDAMRIAEGARGHPEKPSVEKRTEKPKFPSAVSATGKKQKTSVEKRTETSVEKRTENSIFPVAETATTVPVSKSALLSISRGGGGGSGGALHQHPPSSQSSRGNGQDTEPASSRCPSM
jgi:hypothetical protein